MSLLQPGRIKRLGAGQLLASRGSLPFPSSLTLPPPAHCSLLPQRPPACAPREPADSLPGLWSFWVRSLPWKVRQVKTVTFTWAQEARWSTLWRPWTMSPFTAKLRQANACRPSGRCRELSITCAWTGPRPVRTAAVSHQGWAPAPTPSFILSSGWPGRGPSLSTSLSCPSPKCCALRGRSEEMREHGSTLWGGPKETAWSPALSHALVLPHHTRVQG